MNGSSILKMNCGSSPVNSDLNLQISDLRFELPRYLGDVCVYKKRLPLACTIIKNKK